MGEEDVAPEPGEFREWGHPVLSRERADQTIRRGADDAESPRRFGERALDLPQHTLKRRSPERIVEKDDADVGRETVAGHVQSVELDILTAQP